MASDDEGEVNEFTDEFCEQIGAELANAPKQQITLELPPYVANFFKSFGKDPAQLMVKVLADYVWEFEKK